MKRVRDALIVVVLGGVVLFFALRFFAWFQKHSVAVDPIVQQAEIACLNDRMDCHVGSDSFSSVEDAEAYLKSPEHLRKVTEREQKAAREADFTARVTSLLMKQGKSKIKAMCRRDGTFNCDLITNDNLKTFAEMLVRKTQARSTSKEPETP